MGRALAVGLGLGLVWGLVARGFMRLLATAPEFTWEGTFAIIGSATVVGGVVALVREARLTGRSRWWRAAGVPFVLLFAAAGALMLPGVVGIVLLLGSRVWLRVAGLGLVGVSLWAVVQEVGSPQGRQWLGLAVLLGCLAVEGWAAHELVHRWTPRRVEPVGTVAARVAVP